MRKDELASKQNNLQGGSSHPKVIPQKKRGQRDLNQYITMEQKIHVDYFINKFHVSDVYSEIH